MNGWIENYQQATDCSILAIAIATVFVITGSWRAPMGDEEFRYRQIIATSCAIWALPLCTGMENFGFRAVELTPLWHCRISCLGKGLVCARDGKLVKPVHPPRKSAISLRDRCWLVAKPVYLRYVLTHGWRFLFIAAEVRFSILCVRTMLNPPRSVSIHIWWVLCRREKKLTLDS